MKEKFWQGNGCKIIIIIIINFFIFVEFLHMPFFFIQYKLYLEYVLWLWRHDIQIYLLSLAANIFTNPIFCFTFWTINMILSEIK